MSSSTTMGPTASVVNGIVQQNETVTTKTAEEMNSLGKDTFLRLLVTQMENQDPLQPTSDTEWVSQLATYSQLEQMQNMNQSLTNNQAFNLVGQKVLINTTTDAGETKTVNGSVDYVTVKSGKAFLSVGGTLYSMDDLVSVIDYDYLVKNCTPKVEAASVVYDKANPADISFKVTMGSDEGKATAVAIILNDEVISSEYVTLGEDGTVTVSGKAFENLAEGSYTPSLIFNDSFNTTSTGNLLITITNSTEDADIPSEDSTGDASESKETE